MTEAIVNTMRKLFLLSFLIIAAIAYGRKISENEAASIASEFLGSASVTQNAPKSSVRRAPGQKVEKDGDAPFYVFNDTDGNGFVIISGDDRAKKILGYSEKGYFDFNKIPPQLEDLLNRYVDHLKVVPAESPADISWKETSVLNSDGEEILLSTAEWGQGAPYNSQTPVINDVQAPTGCVATAMAIVMKYHQWPKHTYGKKVRNFYHNDIIVDYNNFTINWENLNKDAEKFNEEVSRLMLLTGTSVHTHYEQWESGASMNGISHELITTFGFSSDCSYLRRQFYSEQEWRSLIDEQLTAGLPIIYGSTMENSWMGHTYVLDGKSGDMYHFNWGWDGNFNGYFKLDFLNPSDINYSDHQSMIINIKPESNPTPQSFSPLHVVYGWNTNFRTGQINSTASEIKRNEPITFTGPVLSFPNVFHGLVNYALVDENNNIIELATPLMLINSEYDGTNPLSPEDFCEIPSEKKGWRLDNDHGSFPIEAYALSDFCRTFVFTQTDIRSDHRVVLMSKEDTEQEWKLILGLNGTINYIPALNINSLWADVEWSYDSDYMEIKPFDPHFPGETKTKVLRYQDYKRYNLVYENGNAKVFINDKLIDNQDYSDSYLGEFYDNIENEYPWLGFPSDLSKYAIRVEYSPDSENGVLATGVFLDERYLNMIVGETTTLTAKITPNKVTDKTLTWVSSNENIVTVSSAGEIEAMGEGTATITVKTANGKMAICHVIVCPVYVNTILLNPWEWSGTEGESFRIVTNILPEDATNKVIAWSSSDENVATVDDSGLISLIKKGAAVVTASATDGSGVSAECAVVVTEFSGIEDILTDKNTFVRIFNLKGVLIYEGLYSEANLVPDYYIVVCDGKNIKLKVE